jgi:hypothetical protein
VRPGHATVSVASGKAAVSGDGERRTLRLVPAEAGPEVTVQVEAKGYESVRRSIPIGAQPAAETMVFDLPPAKHWVWLRDMPAVRGSAEFWKPDLGEHSFSVSPPADGQGVASVVYEIAGLRTFHGRAAMLPDAPADSQSPMVFEVYGDGKLVWQSGPIQRRGDGEECLCDVTGMKRLELWVYCKGGNDNARGAWIDPYFLETDAFVAKAAEAKKAAQSRSQPAPGPTPTPEAAKPRRIPVYKVVFPGDVLLTTNEQEVQNIVKVYPGEFRGDRGHWSGILGYAYAEPQDGTVQLRRYLVGNKRLFSTRKLDNPNYKEEGLGAWVLVNKVPGASAQFGFLRTNDSAREYGPESVTKQFGKLGYRPTDLRFYLLDKPEAP